MISPPVKDIQLNRQFLLGTNYWPAHAGIHMWTNWRPELMRRDLETMLELGMNSHRFFLFMPDFLPTPDVTDPKMLKRFNEYLALCADAGIGGFPCFFVGHMSGQNWDVPWRNKRSFYSDPELLDIEERYIEDVVQAANSSPALQGWILSNEIPVFEPQGDSDAVAAWAARMVAAVRRHDPHNPVSLGDGCWAPEVSRRALNFPLSKLASMQDFLGLHFYPRLENPWRQSFTAAFRLQMAAAWGKPVMIEEFGHSTTMGSEENQAHYYRSTLYSSLINGSCGAYNWCFTDFDLQDQEPYSHHPFEMRFGLVRTDGTFKAAAGEMHGFKELSQELYSDDWELSDGPQVGLTIPRAYYQEAQSDWDHQFQDWYPLYLDTFANLKRANLSVRTIFEPTASGANFNSDHLINNNIKAVPLLVLPRLKRITAPFWQQILDYVRAGGHLYASFAHDHWINDCDETFSIQSDLRFGLPAHNPYDQTYLTVKADWLRRPNLEGSSLHFPEKTIETAFCPVVNLTSEVLIEDSEGNPVLVARKFGKGIIYYSLYPMEMLVLKSGDTPLSSFWGKILKALWSRAAGTQAIEVLGQDLEWGLWRHGKTNAYKIVVVNHAWETRRGSVIVRSEDLHVTNANAPYTDQEDNKIEFELDRKAVFICQLQSTFSDGMSKKHQRVSQLAIEGALP